VTFYFYDLETSGIDRRTARIMQFAGQRMDMNLKPIGEPDNILVKMTPDILPDPDAVLVHGITPQKTIAEGISEAELIKYLTSQVFIPDTIAIGYNNIRFDDEFIRFLFWRNFNDAYEWQWKDSRSKWDLLDVVRMTRALRPETIEWAFASDGTPSNRLADITAVNKLEHTSAHDALSDVLASAAVARLIMSKQPKLFGYLLNIRDKNKVAALVGAGQPFIYTSGRYQSEYQKTTVAVMIAPNPDRGSAFVYDLRIDPEEYINLSPDKLAELWQMRGKDAPYFPIKELKYNRCPAVAPLQVLDSASATRLSIDSKKIDANLAKLKKAKDFGDKLIRAHEITQPKTQPGMVVDDLKVDEMLYDGFVSNNDKPKMSVVRAADVDELADLSLDFADERLAKLLPLYKARNYPKSLTGDDQKYWEDYCAQKLLGGGTESRAAGYFKRLEELSVQKNTTAEQRYLLEELQLYGQSIVPLEP
jgi:exodeoxyribonuclease I